MVKKAKQKRNFMSGLFLLLWYPVAIFEWKIETSTPETCHCSKFCIHVAFPIFGTWYLGCTGERKLQSTQEGFHNEWAATDALRHQCRGPRQRRAVDQVALALCRWEGLIFHQERRKRRKLEKKDKQTGFLTSDAEKKKVFASQTMMSSNVASASWLPQEKKGGKKRTWPQVLVVSIVRVNPNPAGSVSHSGFMSSVVAPISWCLRLPIFLVPESLAKDKLALAIEAIGNPSNRS